MDQETKRAIHAPDKFQQFFTRLYNLFSNNKKVFYIGSSALLLIFAGSIAVKLTLDNQYQTSLNSISQNFNDDLKADLESEETINKILHTYKIISADNSDSIFTDRSFISRGNLLAKLKIWDKSLEEYEKVYNNIESHWFYRTYAAFSIINIFREQEKFDEALELLENFDVVGFEDRVLLETGLTLFRMNKNKEAKIQFQNLVEQFPNSNFINYSYNFIKLL